MDTWHTRAAQLTAQLTVEEQATLLSGDGWWDTHAIPRVGLRAITMADGPHGLRRTQPGQAGLADSVPATCFPTASALAATWNAGLVQATGQAIAREARAQGVHVLLGPGVNIKRSPLGGRNFEYFSEDPWLAGLLAAAYIRGVQGEGVGTSLKHFAVNSQEHERIVSDSQVDERTLHEIYLPAFEIAVRQAQPWTVMSAYNRVNGQCATEHRGLLTDILRGQWGFEGFVVSDWGAVNDRVAALQAGNHLEMPGTGTYHRDKLVQAVADGRLSAAALAQAATQLLRVVLMAQEMAHDAQPPDAPRPPADLDAHHQLARQVAGEAIVLLRNQPVQGMPVLPLAPRQRVAVIGGYARLPRYQGAGSSQVNPSRLATAWDELNALLGPAEGGGQSTLLQADGFGPDGEASDDQIHQAATLAARADVALLFVGLPDSYESEGFDRSGIDLPASQNRLVSAVAAAQPRCVVVLHNGSAVAMPWLDSVAAVLEAWLGGQAGGAAVADVLTGRVNPSGKLAETFAHRLQDTSAYPQFPGRGRRALYGEGLFVGYRHHVARDIAPLFPFGFGLSYTQFRLSDLQVANDHFDVQGDGPLRLSVAVTNTGARSGQAVVQLYLQAHDARLPRPPLELRAFDKRALQPGETQRLHFTLSARDFAHWQPDQRRWQVDDGRFSLHVGQSSADLPLRHTITVRGDAPTPVFHAQSFIGELRQAPGGAALHAQLVGALNLGDILAATEPPAGSTPAQVVDWHKRRDMMQVFIDALPVGKLPAFSGGAFSEAALAALLHKANGGDGHTGAGAVAG